MWSLFRSPTYRKLVFWFEYNFLPNLLPHISSFLADSIDEHRCWLHTEPSDEHYPDPGVHHYEKCYSEVRSGMDEDNDTNSTLEMEEEDYDYSDEDEYYDYNDGEDDYDYDYVDVDDSVSDNVNATETSTTAAPLTIEDDSEWDHADENQQESLDQTELTHRDENESTRNGAFDNTDAPATGESNSILSEDGEVGGNIHEIGRNESYYEDGEQFAVNGVSWWDGDIGGISGNGVHESNANETGANIDEVESARTTTVIPERVEEGQNRINSVGTSDDEDATEGDEETNKLLSDEMSVDTATDDWDEGRANEDDESSMNIDGDTSTTGTVEANQSTLHADADDSNASNNGSNDGAAVERDDGDNDVTAEVIEVDDYDAREGTAQGSVDYDDVGYRSGYRDSPVPVGRGPSTSYSRTNSYPPGPSTSYSRTNSYPPGPSGSYSKTNSYASGHTRSYGRANSHPPGPSTSYGRANAHPPGPSTSYGRANSHLPRSSASYGRANSHLPRSSASYGRANSHQPEPSTSYDRASSHLPGSSTSYGRASSHLPESATSYGRANSYLPEPQWNPTETLPGKCFSGIKKCCAFGWCNL